MNKYYKFFLLSALLMLGVPEAHATSYLTINATAGVTNSSGFNDCDYNSGGYVIDGGSVCLLYYPIPLPSGTTINYIKVYYYDNSGSQYVNGGMEKFNVTSSSTSSTTLGSWSDYTTSASVQTATYTPSSAITMSSGYGYHVWVLLSDESQIMGIKVSYN